MKLRIKDGWIPSRIIYKDNSKFLELARLQYPRPRETFIAYDLNRSKQKAYIHPSELFKKDKFTHHIKPAGFIFHLSRCGSTLLSEMFRTLFQYQVISESEAIGNVFQSFNCSEKEHVIAIQNIAGLFQRSICKNEEELIFKFSSWNAIAIKTIQMAFPDTPCLFLYRDPSEVMISMLHGAPVWLKREFINHKLQIARQAIKADLPVDIYTQMFLRAEYEETTPDVEIYAQLLGDICQQIANAPHPILAINYTSLPEAMPNTIAPYFGVNLDTTEVKRIQTVSKRDTKQVGKKKVFVADQDKKQKEVTPEIRKAVELHITPKLEQVITKSLNPEDFRPSDHEPKQQKAQHKSENNDRKSKSAVIKWL